MTLLATMMLLIFEDDDEVQGVDLYEAALGDHDNDDDDLDEAALVVDHHVDHQVDHCVDLDEAALDDHDNDDVDLDEAALGVDHHVDHQVDHSVDLDEAALGVDHHGFKDGLLGGEGGSNIPSAPILQHQDHADIPTFTS